MMINNVIALDRRFNGVIEVSAELAFDWMGTGEAVLLDVREQEELEMEWIPGATAMPLSKFNPDNVPVMGTKKIIFICQTGRRSNEAAERLLTRGLFDIYNVKDGLLAWNAAGLPSIDQSALLI